MDFGVRFMDFRIAIKYSWSRTFGIKISSDKDLLCKGLRFYFSGISRSLFLMRALSKFISSAERLFSNLQLSLKCLKNDNAISFNLVLKLSFSSVIIDKCKVLLYNSSHSVIKLE